MVAPKSSHDFLEFSKATSTKRRPHRVKGPLSHFLFYGKQTLGLIYSFNKHSLCPSSGPSMSYAEGTPGKHKIIIIPAFKEAQSLRRDSCLKPHFYFGWLDPFWPPEQLLRAVKELPLSSHLIPHPLWWGERGAETDQVQVPLPSSCSSFLNL